MEIEEAEDKAFEEMEPIYSLQRSRKSRLKHKERSNPQESTGYSGQTARR